MLSFNEKKYHKLNNDNKLKNCFDLMAKFKLTFRNQKKK